MDERQREQFKEMIHDEKGGVDRNGTDTDHGFHKLEQFARQIVGLE